MAIIPINQKNLYPLIYKPVTGDLCHRYPLRNQTYEKFNKLCKTKPISKMTKLTQLSIYKQLMKEIALSSTQKTKPNEANVKIGKICVSCLLERYYKKNTNKAQKKQTQSKPISKMAKINTSLSITKSYIKNPNSQPGKTNPNKPNQTQFKTGRLLIYRLNQICCVCGFTAPLESAKMAQ